MSPFCFSYFLNTSVIKTIKFLQDLISFSQRMGLVGGEEIRGVVVSTTQFFAHQPAPPPAALPVKTHRA